MEHKRSHSFCLFLLDYCNFPVESASTQHILPFAQLEPVRILSYKSTKAKIILWLWYDLWLSGMSQKKTRKGTSKMWKLLSHHSNSCSIQNPSNNQTLVDHKIKPAYFQYINTTQTKHYTFVVIILFSHSSFKIRHLFNRSALLAVRVTIKGCRCKLRWKWPDK